jgi:polysaccharide pyruvyl transferase WcaK-like protein
MHPNQTTKKAVRIGILDVLGVGSLGDEATQQAMIQNILKYHPNAEIYGFSCDPKDTLARHGIQSFPINRVCGKCHWWLGNNPGALAKQLVEVLDKFKSSSNPVARAIGSKLVGSWLEILASIRAYKSLGNLDLDLLIVSGGGQLDDDFHGAWYEPYILFFWGILARLHHVKFAIVSVGVGNIASKLSRFFIKVGLSVACYRSYRDNISKQYLEDVLRFKNSDSIYPDLAHSLQLQEFSKLIIQDEPQVVAVNPLHFVPGYWSGLEDAAYDEYLNKLAEFIDWLAQNNYKIIMFSSCIGEDTSVTKLVKDVLQHSGKSIPDDQIVDAAILTVEDLILQLSNVSIVVASRLHSVLLATLLNKPIIALAYHFKLDMVMQEMGQSEYCLRIDHFSVEELKEKFISLEKNRETIKAQLGQETQRCQLALDQQYQYLFKQLLHQ